MRRARWPVFGVLAALVLAACGDTPTAAQSAPSQTPASPAGDPVVAEVAGRTITLSEVDAKWQEFDAAERARVTQLLYQNRRNMLDLLVGDALIAEAAKAANLSVEAYTEREVGKRLQPVTPADVQRFYDENKERAQGRTMDELRGPITDFLASQRQAQARAALVDELGTRSGSVRLLLEPPRQEVEISSADPALGPADAPVTLVEFSDYQ